LNDKMFYGNGRTIGGQIQTVFSCFFAFRDESRFSSDPPADPLFKPLHRDFRVVAGEGIERPAMTAPEASTNAISRLIGRSSGC
jgi:hypothetical protein